MAQHEQQRLCESIARLFAIADDLRRTNAAKWRVSLIDWQAAVDDVLNRLETRPIESEAEIEAVRAARSAVRRLANSGDARFGSASVGRDPDSSLAGCRFYDDLKATQRRLAVFQSPGDADQGAAPNRSGN